MSSQSLSSRLQTLSDTYRLTLELIQRLQKLPSIPGSGSSSVDPRVELATEIHQSLKEQEDSLEIIRQEADDGTAESVAGGGRWVGGGSVIKRRESAREEERERNAATIARLGEDLKTARASFRRAQLQAKRNADAGRRKEREMLFANRSDDAEYLAPTRQKGQERLTQDDLAKNASSDVTAGLRRLHNLLEGSVEKSEFAQQTLVESNATLAYLNESYSGLGGLLKNSKGLAGQLLRSQKSDTWYLETAFYIIVATIAWLVFRRVIYGPAWWLIWQPLRWSWWVFMSILGGVGITGGKAVVPSPSVRSIVPGFNSNGVPTNRPGQSPPSMYVGGKGGGWDRPSEPPAQQSAESMLDKIGEMAQMAQDGGVPGDAISGEAPESNTKKRMMEVEQTTAIRNEL